MEGKDYTRGGSPRDSRVAALLESRQQLTDELAERPYDIILYLRRAAVYADLVYPDLAAGDAYRALLLTDEISDESFEYHSQTLEAMAAYVGDSSLPDALQHLSLAEAAPTGTTETAKPDVGAKEDKKHAAPGLEACQKLAATAATRCYQILSHNLLLCGCLRSAHTFCERGLAAAPDDKDLLEIKGSIDTVARRRLQKRRVGDSGTKGGGGKDTFEYNSLDLPDRGAVRREVYPWNTYEPDRFADEALAFLNDKLSRAAPKCEVRVTELPILTEQDGGSGRRSADGGDNNGDGDGGAIPTCRQLGIFAKEPIAAGEVVLREYSLLTANNRLKESACDACGTELPALADIGKTSTTSDGPIAAPVACPDCYDTVFCDDFCFEQAQAKYHPVVCETDVDAIAKDPEDARNADDALYVLLLARLLAMATHQECHPLEVDEVKYMWGDFLPSQSLNSDANDVDVDLLSPEADVQLPPPTWTLPFSFEANIATPLHILEKMDLDVFADLALYDMWVLNTLYAKFRGTASARKSTRDGRPDVAAVHPLWCLANHDCDPNVTWEWGGRMALWARKEGVKLHEGEEEGIEDEKEKRPGAISAGQEILSHYCDVDLPVQLRREWASGSLGGSCMCQRCRNEAAAEAKKAAQELSNGTNEAS